MKNSNNKRTRLEAVRPGDILTLQRDRFRVLSAQQEADLVTLLLDDTPREPLTLIGVPSMAVNVESDNNGLDTAADPDGQ